MNRRIRITACGAVQGVGFRPFVYRLAQELGLQGWVSNSSQGVVVEAEGAPERLEALLLRMGTDRPPHAFLQSVESSLLDPVGYRGFEIRKSTSVGAPRALALPDIATCPECLREIFDPSDRRHLYPFTNCTHCGPRFTILQALPYDRQNTSMRAFIMCGDCQREYEDPLDRRFHAQPNACPSCGPQLALWDDLGRVLTTRHEALLRAAAALRAGQIVAVKGIGGFHLLVDAVDAAAVQRLRHRKHREQKPLALMFPGLDSVRNHCHVSALEERLLLSSESPIVLLQRRRDASAPLAASVAPGNPDLGAMLPYAPLHHILLRELGSPVVATSGNLSEEPICTDEHEALQRLGRIADLFLVHDRPIVRHMDDSIVRVLMGRELVLRRARGYAPLPVPMPLPGSDAPCILAVGGHLKNAVALAVQDQAFLGQHIGDLENRESVRAFVRVQDDLQRLYAAQPRLIAADAHPDYASTRHAQSLGAPMVAVQHHYAHVCACMAENQLYDAVLGVAWDGTGYGPDGTIWGGEFLVADRDGYARVAALRPFPLPGGELAVREPRRAAVGVLHELLGADPLSRTDLLPIASFTAGERGLLARMLERRLQSPITTSAGRLFDAVAALVGLRQAASFEGQAAMELEFAAAEDPAGPADDCDPYPFEVRPSGSDAPFAPTLSVDWGSTIEAILNDLADGLPVSRVSRRFHEMLACCILEVARRAEGLGVGSETGRRVVLTGGCFQNMLLTQRAVARLEGAGFRPYWHQRVPPNDGGLALGQIVAARRAWHATGRPNKPGLATASGRASDAQPGKECDVPRGAR